MKYVKLFEEHTDEDTMLNGYLTTALWTEESELGSEFDIKDISSNSVDQAKKDCDRFKMLVGSTIISKYDLFTIGHDFWLTRNNHGAGFWDGDYDDEDEKILMAITDTFGTKLMYEGDDGTIYID